MLSIFSYEITNYLCSQTAINEVLSISSLVGCKKDEIKIESVTKNNRSIRNWVSKLLQFVSITTTTSKIKFDQLSIKLFYRPVLIIFMQ